MSGQHTTNLSGVLLCINNAGVLLRGPAGIGKSELALTLLERGHQLVADDSVIITRQQQHLMGEPVHPLMQGFIEVRDLGVLHAGKLFGDHVVVPSSPLDLIVELQPDTYASDRINGSYQTTTLLGITVNQVIFSTVQQRRLDLLVEVALQQCQLRTQSHYDSRQHFCHHHQLMMAQQCEETLHER